MYLLIPNPQNKKVQPHLKPHEFFLSVLDMYLPIPGTTYLSDTGFWSGVEWSVNLYKHNHPKNEASSKGKVSKPRW